MNIYDHGHWEDKVWHFNEPRIIDGATIEKLDFSHATMPADVDLEEIISMFMDPRSHREPASPEDNLLYDHLPSEN